MSLRERVEMLEMSRECDQDGRPRFFVEKLPEVVAFSKQFLEDFAPENVALIEQKRNGDDGWWLTMLFENGQATFEVMEEDPYANIVMAELRYWEPKQSW